MDFCMPAISQRALKHCSLSSDLDRCAIWLESHNAQQTGQKETEQMSLQSVSSLEWPGHTC